MTRIKVPNSIKIGGHKYRIILDNGRLIDDNSNAEINHRTLEISINAARPDSQKREALIHEILHGVDRIYEGHCEERTIASLSEGLNQAFDELGIDFKWGDVTRR